jgi:hypothetical protein
MFPKLGRYGFMKNAWVYLIVVLLSLADCSSDTSPAIIDPIWVDHGSGVVQFHTNNPAHYNRAFYSSEIDVSDIVSGDTYEITARKISGSDNYGYGMLFCMDSNSYYRFFITARQQYTIQKFISGVGQTPLQNWTASTEIRPGYGVDNKLKVVRTYSNGTAAFTVYINDVRVASLSDHAPVNGTEAQLAASVDTEPNENFPNIPVEVWFNY